MFSIQQSCDKYVKKITYDQDTIEVTKSGLYATQVLRLSKNLN